MATQRFVIFYPEIVGKYDPTRRTAPSFFQMGWFNSTTNFFLPSPGWLFSLVFVFCFFLGFAHTPPGKDRWLNSHVGLGLSIAPVSKSPPFGGWNRRLLFRWYKQTKTAFPESSDLKGRTSHCLHLFLGFVPGILLLGTMPLLLVFMLYLWPGIVEDQDHGLVWLGEKM